MFHIVDAYKNTIGAEINGVVYDYHFLDINKLQNIDFIYGIFTKSGILTEHGLYHPASSVLNLSNYFYTLTNINIKLNDIVFISCDFNDLVCEGLTEIWSKSLFSLPNSYIYSCIDSNTMQEVAYLLIKQNLYCSKDISISMIECFKKGHGFGTRIIRQLKLLDKRINGLAISTAKDFWEKQGVVFDSNNYYFSI